MLTPHAPIRINNDTDFVTLGFNGSGTAGDPWIIENYEIDGTGNGSCIYIGNVTQHFVVRNCVLANATEGGDSIYRFNASIMMFNASNGTLQNNTAAGSWYGIYLYNNSHNNTIERNTVHDNGECGIILDIGSADIRVDNNTAHGNGNQGIYLYSAERTRLGFNNASSNGRYGIHLYSASNNTIYNCSAGNNTVGGLFLYLGSNGNSVTGSRFAHNDYGIRVQGSAGNAIFHNEIINNTIQGYDNTGSNAWDGGYPSGGNYWSDYSGSDAFNGPGQNVAGGDGIGDSAYPITGGASQDRYPLMSPYSGEILGETVPPFAISYSPNGTAVSADSIITITWNETMDWASVVAAFEYTDGTTNWTSADGSWDHDSTTNISAFTPVIPFSYETHYVVTVNSSASDLAGNRLDQNRNGTGGEWPHDILQWSFTTTDEAPYVVSTQPADSQMDVDPFKPIKIVFSERMNRTSVHAAFSYTDGNRTWNITDGSGYWNALQTEFTFAPTAALEINTTFTVTVDGILAMDIGGKGLKDGDYAWWFTTWLEPPAPRITSTYPPDGAFNVNVNTYINIAFDSEMDTQSVEAAFSYTDGTRVWTIVNGTVDWYADYSLLSFQPAERLSFDTDYVVRLTANATSIYGVHLDGNSNGIPDQDDDYTFRFTTIVEPPTVTSHYPSPLQMNVPTNLRAIYVNFSKVMLTSSVINAISISPTTPYSATFMAGGKNLTIVLNSQLQQGTEYRVNIFGTAIDIMGIKLDGNGDGWPGDRFGFSFYTEGIEIPTAPTILGVVPPNNATIPVEPFFLTISFSAPMNRTSVEAAFRFRNASAEVNGTFAWSGTNKTMRFTPTGALAYNTTYIATLSGNAKGENGMAMGNSTTWQYLTEEAEVVRSLWEWVLYGTIIGLVALSVMLYMANRSLRMELKRTRVKLKRLKRQAGIKDEDVQPESQETEFVVEKQVDEPEPPIEDIPPENLDR
jgi:parallel beta-helix repeat protein